MATVAELIGVQSQRVGPGLLGPDGLRYQHPEIAAQAATRAALFGERHRPGMHPHIGVLLGNGEEFAFWLSAAALAGAALVGVNPTRRGAELARDVRHAECELLVTSHALRPLLAGLGLDDLPLLVVDEPGYAEALAPYRGLAVADVAPVAPVTEDTRLLLYFTSGSTGAPKAVTCRQGRVVASGAMMAERFDLTPSDVCYIPMPMFHGNAILANWGPALVAGATIALPDRFSASGFLPDVREYQATYFTYVGRAISYILATPEHPSDAVNPLRAGFGTEAGPLDRDRFERRFGCRLSEGYGASEGGINLPAPRTFPPAVLARGAAVGRTEPALSILDLETGKPCPPGEFDAAGRLLNGAVAIGELVRTGPGGFTGYWNNPAADAERYCDGVYYSGDLFYADTDGWLYFAARKADRMRVDGENISVALLEAILSRWDPVEAVAAYAVPDEVTGDAVMCALVLKRDAGFEPKTFADFLAAQADLGTKMAPRFVRVTAALQTTATAKVSRYALREQGWWDVGGDAVWERRGRGSEYRPLRGPQDQ
ncbi:AMP-binding protein [Catenulispora sp. NL8]|uniref:AMP-binding protein n=1 Tax=Catenulispora pinistramenti TaxID=2705254 RepID=A0ABS5KZ10_9ACTN|nr:AMP-binding protein [Catenulispora pinistramenti]MBS2551289.1 AMP-binding protein [Catenulispora pinistramenti]